MFPVFFAKRGEPELSALRIDAPIPLVQRSMICLSLSFRPIISQSTAGMPLTFRTLTECLRPCRSQQRPPGSGTGSTIPRLNYSVLLPPTVQLATSCRNNVLCSAGADCAAGRNRFATKSYKIFSIPNFPATSPNLCRDVNPRPLDLCLLSLVCAASSPPIGGVFICPAYCAGTTFYPERRDSFPSCDIRHWRMLSPLVRAPHLYLRSGLPDPGDVRARRASELVGLVCEVGPTAIPAPALPYAACGAGLRIAPAGTTSVSRYRQRAISNLRARATIPIRRIRGPPVAYRRANHWLRSL